MPHSRFLDYLYERSDLPWDEEAREPGRLRLTITLPLAGEHEPACVEVQVRMLTDTLASDRLLAVLAAAVTDQLQLMHPHFEPLDEAVNEAGQKLADYLGKLPLLHAPPLNDLFGAAATDQPVEDDP